MTAEPLSFFTVDRGTASTAVALIAPVDGRFHLLAASVGPASIDTDAMLEDLVRRVSAADPAALPVPDGWRDWARLESLTAAPSRICCVAASERLLHELERALSTNGWEIAARAASLKPADQLAVSEACLDPRVAAIAFAASEPPLPEERSALPAMAALAGSAAHRREDLQVLLSGGATGWGDAFPAARAIAAPAPPAPSDGGVVGPATAFRDALGSLRARVMGSAPGSPPDGRQSLRVATETLAGLLERHVETVEIGFSAGSRTLAGPVGLIRHLVAADAALIPASVLTDDHEVERILRWNTIRADQFSLQDRIRNLRLGPWRDAAGDGARLRLAALRAALVRLETAWQGLGGPQDRDLLVVSGGAFAAVPPPAAALALVDTLRRPGALAIYHDHARVLGPIGTLPDTADRRRLIADLIDDALLPLGSAIVAGEVRSGRHRGVLRVSSELQHSEMELVPGTLRMVDLPPGVAAHVELEARDGALLGLRSRHVAVEVTGGLAGLLVDTREVPLRLPDRAERRRAVIEGWERPVWVASEL